MEKYYKILEIHINATEQEVTRAYREMIKVWHPDRFPNDIKLQKKANEKLKEINDAYQRIINHLKNSHKQQQSQQYERTEKQDKQASQPPPRQTKPNKLRHLKKYWGLYLFLVLLFLWESPQIIKLLGSPDSTSIPGRNISEQPKTNKLGLVDNAGISTDNQPTSTNQESQIIKLILNDAKGYFLQGVEKGRLQDYTGAIDDFNKAIELTPENADAYYYRGNAKNYLQDFTGATQDYNKAIELNPKDAKAYSAIQFYSKKIELEPTNVLFYYKRGEAKYTLQAYTGAVQDFSEAIEVSPKASLLTSEAYYFRGCTKEMLKDKRGALEDLSKAGGTGGMEGLRNAYTKIRKGDTKNTKRGLIENSGNTLLNY